jgi:hypothetical protein
MAPKHPPEPASPVRITIEECCSQAQKCIEEKPQSNPKLSATLMALAEQWVLVAETAGRTKAR